jgi:hypothetical protein
MEKRCLFPLPVADEARVKASKGSTIGVAGQCHVI